MAAFGDHSQSEDSSPLSEDDSDVDEDLPVSLSKKAQPQRPSRTRDVDESNILPRRRQPKLSAKQKAISEYHCIFELNTSQLMTPVYTDEAEAAKQIKRLEQELKTLKKQSKPVQSSFFLYLIQLTTHHRRKETKDFNILHRR